MKIVVTDDQGRYVMPDLPKANYNVWVRGYGLVDSSKVKTMPGKIVNLNAVIATTPANRYELVPISVSPRYLGFERIVLFEKNLDMFHKGAIIIPCSKPSRKGLAAR